VPLPPRLTGFGQGNIRLMAKALFLFASLGASADVTTQNNCSQSVFLASWCALQRVLRSSRHCCAVEFLRASYGVCERD